MGEFKLPPARAVKGINRQFTLGGVALGYARRQPAFSSLFESALPVSLKGDLDDISVVDN